MRTHIKIDEDFKGKDMTVILPITTRSITADLFIAEHGNFTNLSVDKVFVIGRQNTDKSVKLPLKSLN